MTQGCVQTPYITGSEHFVTFIHLDGDDAENLKECLEIYDEDIKNVIEDEDLKRQANVSETEVSKKV